MNKKDFLAVLSAELVVAMGCTEPIAVAYAAALAKKHLRGSDIVAVKVQVSGNVLKNAMSVTIPGTHSCGVDMAAALGIVAGDVSKSLEVLAGITEQDVIKAENMIKAGLVSVDIAATDKKLYVEVVIETAQSHAKAVVADDHTRVNLVEADGQVIARGASEEMALDTPEDERSFMSLDTIWEFVQEADISDLGIIAESIELNRRIAQEGLLNAYGLEVGKTIKESINQGILGDDLATHAMALTAAGSDARMAGCPLPVMSNSGSGNQGISATLPVLVTGERRQASYEQIIRSVTLSHLITIYIKSKFGRLSALCGAVISATGASCGITYLLGGGIEQIKIAVQNMLGNVTGMLCDGAKAGCAMKVATCTNAAVQSALLAMAGHGITATEGIIEKSPVHSIENLCRIGNQGTIETDKIILEIMLNKRL